VITASNQDDFFHPFNSQSTLSGEGEPTIDVFDYPLAKITHRLSVFASSIYWE
jgi:hypothetical protein